MIIIRDLTEKKEKDRIRFAFTNTPDADTDTLAKIQSKRYWIERNFEYAKGLCNLDSFRGRSWDSWHHHVALVAIALLFLLRIQMDFVKKRIFLSLNQIVSIIRYKNPLRQLSAEELADSINYVNEIRMKMWFGRMKKCLKEDLKMLRIG